MNFTGERYIPGAIQDGVSGREHWQRYLFSAKFVHDKDVLDIASGAGYGANLLAQTARYVYGVDISNEAIEYALRNYAKDNLKFIQGSVENIPFEANCFDIVVSFETIEHVDADAQRIFLKEIKRILRHNGILIISCPNKKIASDRAYELWDCVNEFHKHEMYLQEFKHVLRTMFKNIVVLSQRTECVQILNDLDTKYLEVVLSEQYDYEHAQNMIAICSDFHIPPNDLGSIVLDIDHLHMAHENNLSSLSRQVANVQAEFARTQAEFARTQAEFARTQAELARTQAELARTQAEFAVARRVLSHPVIRAQRKVWKLIKFRK